jgi:hypothetical protein
MDLGIAAHRCKPCTRLSGAFGSQQGAKDFSLFRDLWVVHVTG